MSQCLRFLGIHISTNLESEMVGGRQAGPPIWDVGFPSDITTTKLMSTKGMEKRGKIKFPSKSGHPFNGRGRRRVIS